MLWTTGDSGSAIRDNPVTKATGVTDALWILWTTQ